MLAEVQVSKIRLRQARVQLRLSQVKLAQLAEVSERTIVHAEQGETIRELTAQAILDALNAARIDRGWNPLGLSDLDWKIQGD